MTDYYSVQKSDAIGLLKDFPLYRALVQSSVQVDHQVGSL